MNNLKKKVFVKNFGCQMNEYDADKMVDILLATNKYIYVDNAEEADVILFNTCSIREKAEEKVFSDIGRVKHLKLANPNVIIGVGGCVATQEGAEIIKRASIVDLVFGPQTIHLLPKMIEDCILTSKPQINIEFKEIEKFDHLPTPTFARIAKQNQNNQRHANAFVSIMEGCSKYCSYCVVPYTRGEEVSRPFYDIIEEIRKLIPFGVREINLLGQNVNAYYGLLSEGNYVDFTYLLTEISKIEEIIRIRYTTSHPKEMNSSLIETYRNLPKLCSHLHLPVQSGSDKVLRAMKRGYTILEYKSILKKIKSLRPNISFSSDFIVGFPGETDEDFEATMSLVDEIKYDMSFSFMYSPRPGTPAANLPSQIPQEIQKERLRKLQDKLQHYTNQISNSMLGNIEQVLVEGRSKKDNSHLFGRCDNYKLVNFICNDISEESLNERIGTLVNVQITEVRGNTLFGCMQ